MQIIGVDLASGLDMSASMNCEPKCAVGANHNRRLRVSTLHTMLRLLPSKIKRQRDHLDVFREFLDHLERAVSRSERKMKSKIARRKPKR